MQIPANRSHGFLSAQIIIIEPSLHSEDKVFPVQKFHVEEEWQTYWSLTESIPAATEDKPSQTTALSVVVKPTNTQHVILALFVLSVLAAVCIVVRIRCARISSSGDPCSPQEVYDTFPKPRRSISIKSTSKLSESVETSCMELQMDASTVNLYRVISRYYKVTSKLGEGTFGAVYRAVDLQTSKEVAVKFPTCPSYAQDVWDEACIMKELNHKNVLEAVNSFYNNTSAALVTELMDGTLSQLNGNKKLRAGHLAAIFRQLLEGISFLHHQKLIHRDIESCNILVRRNGEIKIADFGTAIYTKDVAHEFGYQVGTVNWMAPEIIKGRRYSEKVDIWSLGVVLIELIDGMPCYGRLTKEEIIFKYILKYGAVSKKIYRFNSLLLCDFMSEMLARNPRQRPSAKDLLNHPFIQLVEPAPGLESLASLMEILI
ncbi:serine/threonine-protein kinase pakA-like [Actinia tenebrosa]|uniref:non-specific serine/threonine protein kinase n=1 Tax=Actinia tenebrosa TaxID=6105 RepID=A0A6P8H4B7_ACTTE|nr:serine/threonine-protein kinase pakA-like [Actinia tenebrosa]